MKYFSHVVQQKDSCHSVITPKMSLRVKNRKRCERKKATGQVSFDEEILQSIRTSWRQTIVSMYPGLHHRAHFLPPVYFSHERYRHTTFAGQHVLVDRQTSDISSNDPDTACHQHAPPGVSSHGETGVRCTDTPPASPTQVGEQNSTGQLSVLWTSQPCAPNKETCVQESTLRDDFAQQHVLHCLQALAEHHGEVMFVISQLRFSDYLNRPCYSATTALFPRFSDIEKRFRDGDFDVLVLHRRYGVVIGEIKSVGLHAGTAENSYQNLVDDVAKRVRKAAWQLNKSSEVLRYLLHDLSPPPLVHKALILPYITSNSLGAVLEKYEDLKTTLCQCLETETTDDAVQLCLCSNQMSDRTRPWEFTDDVMSGLSHWWQRLTTHEDDYSMTGDIYEDIVARFCGPATTIRVHCSSSPLMEVRNRGDGVSEVGNRLRKLVLTPQQIDLLVTAPSRVFLSGPCGTGKTVVLVLMALQWLYQGHDVHIVSSWVLGLAASYLVHHQLEGTMQAYQNRSQPTGKVHIHFYNFQKGEEEVTKSINDLVNFAKNETLHIVMDEVYPDPTNNGSEVAILAKSYNQFVMELTAKNREVHLWMAGAMHNCIPYGLEEKQMLVPLRCVPVVQRMLINVVDLEKINIKNYANRIHHSCDGPNIIQLMHAGDGHAERWPLECWQCGFQIAEVLLQHLQIGCGIPEAEPRSVHSGAGKKATASTPPLQFCDVFVLTHGHLHDDHVEDENGQLKSHANRLTVGLRDAGIPVHVVRDYRDYGIAIWEADLKKAVLRKDDKVTLAEWNDVLGLERKVVVYVPGRKDDLDKQFSNEKLETWGKAISMTRCISQLIIVQLSGDDNAYK